MKIHQALLLCVSSAALVTAKMFLGTEGGSVVAPCHFRVSGRTKLLCKDECRERDVLIETRGSNAQRGRYSIRYEEGTFPVSSTVLYVTISQLTKSDSGRYRCGLERHFLPDSYWEFEIRVTDAPKTEQPEWQRVEETTASATDYMVAGFVLPVILSVMVLCAAALWLLYRWRLWRDSDGLNTRRQATCRDTKFAPGSKYAGTNPLAVEEAGRHQIYCNL